jgi:serine protease Do
MKGKLAAWVLLGTVLGGVAAAETPPSGAEGVYAAVRPRLLEVRTIVKATDDQSTLGSGALVSADGLAITNYHVVSQYALQPSDYNLEYRTVEGTRGPLQLLAIDVADDLALVKLEGHDLPHFTVEPGSIIASLAKGERLYSMGYPLDLGFTIVEGTYNGPVDRDYNERIHFSGALNPGMSGGPTVAADGRLVGINVAKRLDGEQVSFLVPARFAAALIARAKDAAPPSLADIRAEIGRQLTQRQADIVHAFDTAGYATATFGRYQAAKSLVPWMTCWAHTNADQTPKPRAATSSSTCTSETSLFVAHDLNTGGIFISHEYVRSRDLNQFQFAAFLAQQARQPASLGGPAGKWKTRARCHDEVIAAPASGDRPPLRARWCASAYRDFPGLYDVSLLAVTEDSGTDALVSRITLQGFTFENAVALSRHALEAVQWKK